MLSNSRLRVSSFMLFMIGVFLPAHSTAGEFGSVNILNTALEKSGSMKQVAGREVTADRKNVSPLPSFEKQVFASLSDYFFQEDEGRSCGIKESDVWGHEMANVVYEGTQLSSADVHTLVNGWAENCAGRVRFSCTTALVRKEGKLTAHYSECAADE